MNSREKFTGYDCTMRHTMDSVRVRLGPKCDMSRNRIVCGWSFDLIATCQFSVCRIFDRYSNF